jgi:hypothetical protein
MDSSDLIRGFPRLYHMAHEDAWDGIQRHGLLSTTALLDLFEIQNPERAKIRSKRRPESVLIEHKIHGKAVIRDNKPLDDEGLLRCLADFSPEEWYQMLNDRVFFWLSEQRLITLLSARAYRRNQHCVITIGTSRFVRDYQDRIWLSPMNSGNTKPIPHPRGANTFQRIKDYSFNDWRARRGSATKAIAELAVDYAVPDILQYVEEVTIRDHRGISSIIYRA